jgi:cysteinyl-tRNA synthetase
MLQEAKVKAAQVKLEEHAEKGDSRNVKEFQEKLEGEKLKLSKVQADAQRFEGIRESAAGTAPEEVARGFHDIIAEHLDSLHGSEVTDIGIYRCAVAAQRTWGGAQVCMHNCAAYRAHAAEFEKQFFDDLDALNVRKPHAIPRITDHIPEIVEFIERIVGNGFAYVAGADGRGSVYFDTVAFRAAGHTYGKLEPWKVGSADLAAEGEANFSTAEKRAPQDFALWKASKPGEPLWASPWGPGRPGWHIECSAMVDAVCGRHIDIHSGGMDLRFPHHDNEIAQSEAHNCGAAPRMHVTHACRRGATRGVRAGACVPRAFREQWCNYWLHSGHLAIDGLKMSKSLKNFITIREALKEFSARQLRLLFCLAAWDRPITFNQQSRAEMVQKEATLKNFFNNVQARLRAPHTHSACIACRVCVCTRARCIAGAAAGQPPGEELHQGAAGAPGAGGSHCREPGRGAQRASGQHRHRDRDGERLWCAPMHAWPHYRPTLRCCAVSKCGSMRMCAAAAAL